MNLGEKIIALRKANGMTQVDLGNELHITYQAVSKWERGESCPDFATLSKIAKLFGVPITYFEDGGEVAVSATAEAEQPVAAEQPVEVEQPVAAAPKEEVQPREMLGVCKSCGKVVYEGEAFQTEPHIICKACHERTEREKKEAILRAAAEKKRAEEYEVRSVKRKRNIGLLVAAAVAAVLIIIGIVQFATKHLQTPEFIILIVFSVFVFTFVSQMIWGGLVRDIGLFGFVKLNFPGIIFTLDIDGLIFFIVVKLLFAFLSIFLWLALGVITMLIALLASPVIFIPKVLRLSTGHDDSD